MTSEHLLKNKKILALVFIILLLIGAFIFLYSSTIFQEGHPGPQIKGIAQLTFGKSDMVKLSGSDNKYLTKSNGGQEAVNSFLKNNGYEFMELMGSGYFYKSSAGNIVVTRRQYSRFYVIWAITEIPANNDLWTKATTGNGMTFQYPKELPAKYISKTEWPPVIRIETGTYSCQTTPPEISSLSEIISQRLVDDRTYCVNIKNEGAAGSVYSSYVYTTVKNGQLVNVSFTLRYPDCNNYDEEQNKACVSEREVFDIDATVDRIVQTIKWDLSQDESPSTQLANPASVNCTKSGGNLVIKKRSDGGEYGVCFFEDNRQCEEWALLRNDCPVGGLKITGYENEAEIFCVITGGKVTGLDTATPMCKRIDGTLCTVSANFDGACPDPNNPTPNAGNVEAQ